MHPPTFKVTPSGDMGSPFGRSSPICGAMSSSWLGAEVPDLSLRPRARQRPAVQLRAVPCPDGDLLLLRPGPWVLQRGLLGGCPR